MKKIFSFLICLSMFLPTSVFALDEQNEDLSQYSYSVSDDENFQDGVMSNPDGSGRVYPAMLLPYVA